MATLFDDVKNAGIADGDITLYQLADALEAELLRNPPVKCLQLGERGRQADARRLARKDAQRLLTALEQAGLIITISSVDAITVSRAEI